MNDNYLWDKSGEPDEEIQQFESLLSEFRYQPRALALPEAMPERRPHATAKALIFSLTPMRYVALAAMLLLALGIGVWLSLRPATNAPDVVKVKPTPTTEPVLEKQAESAPVSPPQASQFARRSQTPAPKVYFAKHTPQRVTRKSLEQEGERAKEKVLYALQITSEKLNLIAKRVQTDTD
jgi:hypothetical protein